MEYVPDVETEIEKTERPHVVLKNIRIIEELKTQGENGKKSLVESGQILVDDILNSLPIIVKEFIYSEELPLRSIRRDLEEGKRTWNAQDAFEWAKARIKSIK